MTTIQLPSAINKVLWKEYVNMDYGRSQFKGYRKYLEHNIPNAEIVGTTKNGFDLTFGSEADYVWFLLRW